MACRFIRVEIVKAGAESSATGLSAYIARDARLSQDGQRFNFAHKAEELEARGLLLPASAPDWAADGGRLWREAERAEQTVDRGTGALRWKKGGQVAKHMTIALPREASPEDREAMLLEFITSEIRPQQHGVAVEWAIHRDEGNPHAHLLISTRILAGEGFGKKARAMNPEFVSKGKSHFIGEAEDWDKRWAAFQARYFARHGIAAELRERLAVPEPHYTRGQLQNEEVAAERREIARANAAAEQTRLRDPAAILEKLTARKAIFTARDIRQAVNKSGLEGIEREALFTAITSHPNALALVDERGEEIGWTTAQVREEEAAIIEAVTRLAASSRPSLGWGRAVLAEAELSDEQRVAAAHVTDGGRIRIVIGRAGTGKSHMMTQVRRSYEAEGYRVIGLAPTNAVVADLKKDGYGQAATLHRELGALERNPSRWDQKTVVVVDEAAMMDNAILLRLLRGAESSGARLILAGDDRQFASVSRGGMFSALVERLGASELTEVRRQRQAYQAKASEDFARGDILAALAAYAARGQVVWCDSLEEARQLAVAAQAAWDGPGFLYASTNKEVEALNRAEQQRRRAQREAAGEPLEAQGFTTIRGEVSIAAGERVQFYETDRRIGVASSEFGTVKSVRPGWMEVVKDDGAVIGFDPVKYDQWGLGYSGTGYKGQGKTQPRTAAVYDNSYAWDARAAYVIGTRHRDDYRLFVPRDLAPDLATLAGQIVREREDRGTSLRFELARTYQARQEMDGQIARRKFRAALDGSRKIRADQTAKAVAEAAIAERERMRSEAERQHQAEELKKTQRLRPEPRPERDWGPSMGM